jgi:organic radical activating enzyme
MLLSDKEYRYSEIFGQTIQGEGYYTGVPTAWLRLFSCNLECKGFGQKDPTDPSTYDLPAENLDVSNITRMEDLPVFERGCDSSYSWSKKFRHLAYKANAATIAERIIDTLKTEHNPEGLFNMKNGAEIHLAFTGGEPMMQQDAIVDVLSYMVDIDNYPRFVTIETNGTQHITQNFKDFFSRHWDIELLFSISPKLFNVSGEKNSKAIRPKVIHEYYEFADMAYLKFVLNGNDAAWAELDEVMNSIGYNESGKFTLYQLPVWIMPVGATVEGQEITAATVARKAISRGYNVAVRAHTYLFSNAMGT